MGTDESGGSANVSEYYDEQEACTDHLRHRDGRPLPNKAIGWRPHTTQSTTPIVMSLGSITMPCP